MYDVSHQRVNERWLRKRKEVQVAGRFGTILYLRLILIRGVGRGCKRVGSVVPGSASQTHNRRRRHAIFAYSIPTWPIVYQDTLPSKSRKGIRCAKGYKDYGIHLLYLYQIPSPL